MKPLNETFTNAGNTTTFTSYFTVGQTKKQMAAWTQWNGKFKTLWEMVSGATQERQNHAVGQWEERGKSSLWHQLQNGLQERPLETCIVKRGAT